MKLSRLAGPILLTLALAWFVWQHFGAEPSPPGAVEPSPSQGAPSATVPEPRYPIENVAAGQPDAIETLAPLPDLADSDDDAMAAIAALLGQDQLPAFLIPEHLIERIVVTVDNLPRQRLPRRGLPVQPAPGRLRTALDDEGRTVLDPENYGRYRQYLAAMDAVDINALVAEYIRAYPLFQQAYRELGYPDRHFNDRLVEVVDHLLAAPTPPAPIRLEPEKGGHTYADPELARLSAGHKLMVRIGPDNASAVRSVLQRLRTALAGQTVPATD